MAPFWADVDTRVAGDVFYRESSDQVLLQQATADVTNACANCGNFRASRLFITTWYRVAFYGARGDYINRVSKHTFSVYVFVH